MAGVEHLELCLYTRALHGSVFKALKSSSIVSLSLFLPRSMDLSSNLYSLLLLISTRICEQVPRPCVMLTLSADTKADIARSH